MSQRFFPGGGLASVLAAHGVECASFGELPVVSLKPGERIEVRLLPSFADPSRTHLALWQHQWPHFSRCRAVTVCPQKTHPELLQYDNEKARNCAACAAGVGYRWNGLVYALVRDKRRAVCLKVTEQNQTAFRDMGQAGSFNFEHGHWIAIAADEGWKWSWSLLEQESVSAFDFDLALTLGELRVRKWIPRTDLLQAMADGYSGWLKAGEPEPALGQHEELLELLPGCIFVRIPWGLKGPRDMEWQNTTWAMMQDVIYRDGLDEGSIGLLCGQDTQAIQEGTLPDTAIVGLDADEEEFASRLIQLNPRLDDTFAVEGGRGRKWFAEVVGDNVARALQSTSIFERRGARQVKVGDWLATGKQGVVLGLHPSGKMYRHNGKPLLRFEQIRLPKTCYCGWHLDDLEAEAGHHHKHSRHSEGAILNPKLLKNVHQGGKGIETACPACQEDGRDSAGDNLLIYPDGRYKCASLIGCSELENRDHNRRIYQLCGINRHDYD
jgi:hypothetical protein